jgi:metal-responsive CopG/Arc/MetJ family transcriptional regulator
LEGLTENREALNEIFGKETYEEFRKELVEELVKGLVSENETLVESARNVVGNIARYLDAKNVNVFYKLVMRGLDELERKNVEVEEGRTWARVEILEGLTENWEALNEIFVEERVRKELVEGLVKELVSKDWRLVERVKDVVGNIAGYLDENKKNEFYSEIGKALEKRNAKEVYEVVRNVAGSDEIDSEVKRELFGNEQVFEVVKEKVVGEIVERLVSGNKKLVESAGYVVGEIARYLDAKKLEEFYSAIAPKLDGERLRFFAKAVLDEINQEQWNELDPKIASDLVHVYEKSLGEIKDKLI